MTEMTRANRRHREGGFTLIELLVVIVILGVLSAVVVFAVRGVDDKGQASADATDKRTISTAEEAYCAQAGQYGTSRQLMGLDPADNGQRYKFLSDEPQNHGVQAFYTGRGKCNGWSFVIGPTEEAQPGPGPGDYEPVGDPSPLSLTQNMVQLADGKVLAVGLVDPLTGGSWLPAAALYDPGTSDWSPLPAPPSGIFDMLLLSEEPCGNHCGKVLAYSFDYNVLGTGWTFFNPATLLWEPVPGSDASYSGKNNYTSTPMVLLTDNPATPSSECSPHCGKVFISAAKSTDPGPYVWELYEPAAGLAGEGSFAQFLYANTTQEDEVGHSVATRLADGRILLTRYLSGTEPKQVAKLFDPRGTTFTNVPGSIYVFPDEAAPLYNWDKNPSVGLQSVTLTNGDVFFTGEPYAGATAAHVTEIYRPSSTGQGAWRSPGASCVPFGVVEPQGCYILATLPDGRVLATTHGQYNNRGSDYGTGKTYLFDPATETWSRSGDIPPYASQVGVVIADPIDPGGSCGLQCGKVLVAGFNTTDFESANLSAYLYTPPTS